MLNLVPTKKFVLRDLQATHNYVSEEVANYFLTNTYYSYYICDDSTRLGLLGIAQTSYFSTNGLLWAGFYNNFNSSLRLLRESRNLSKVFFAQHDLHLMAEVLRADSIGNNFVRYFGMKPLTGNSTIQLYERPAPCKLSR